MNHLRHPTRTAATGTACALTPRWHARHSPQGRDGLAISGTGRAIGAWCAAAAGVWGGASEDAWLRSSSSPSQLLVGLGSHIRRCTRSVKRRQRDCRRRAAWLRPGVVPWKKTQWCTGLRCGCLHDVPRCEGSRLSAHHVYAPQLSCVPGFVSLWEPLLRSTVTKWLHCSRVLIMGSRWP